MIHKVGTLSPGKQADIVLLRADAVNVPPVNDLTGAVVSGTDVSNVDTVLVAGRVVKRSGRLYAMVYAARDRVFAKAEVPCGVADTLLVGIFLPAIPRLTRLAGLAAPTQISGMIFP
ncbi:hypothetical protein JJB99_07855 [Bradyrhizobium diazoefficiens]|uniref:hypothetical protein n=1 Tax=Bradyrhizobium diazoefficiens TaxID=1355477 RepID=UPI00190AA19F|nr:hypothetical protein [Bradyrhizobium diazoefficiens]QQO16057.1 hypothetical protein JJB99_07855 [Bradyrhizobium diazoefficiens]